MGPCGLTGLSCRQAAKRIRHAGAGFLSGVRPLAGWTLAVIRPVVRMTAVMKRLADGNLNVEIPSVARRDEVGSMARAVEIFKPATVENCACRTGL